MFSLHVSINMSLVLGGKVKFRIKRDFLEKENTVLSIIKQESAKIYCLQATYLEELIFLCVVMDFPEAFTL